MERYCVVEHPLDSLYVFAEPLQKIPAVILKVFFKTLGGMMERCCALEYL